jgi:hypothetical protein
MNDIRIFALATLVVASLLPTGCFAGTLACSYSSADRATWIALLSRQLRNNDPAHATQMSKVATEIIDGQVDELKLDIASGLSPNAVFKLGATPVNHMPLLTLASAACQVSAVQQLVSAGASVNGPEAGATPLVVAAAKGAVPIMQYLIQHGATIDKTDENGHTALEDAVRQRQLSAVQVLLSYGGNPNRQLGGGGTILDLVNRSADPTDQLIASELRKHGAGGALAPRATSG